MIKVLKSCIDFKISKMKREFHKGEAPKKKELLGNNSFRHFWAV